MGESLQRNCEQGYTCFVGGAECYGEQQQGRELECKGLGGAGELTKWLSGPPPHPASSWQNHKCKGPEVAETPLWLQGVRGGGGKEAAAMRPDLQAPAGQGEDYSGFSRQRD